jgi:hypothetical protein
MKGHEAQQIVEKNDGALGGMVINELTGELKKGEFEGN